MTFCPCTWPALDRANSMNYEMTKFVSVGHEKVWAVLTTRQSITLTHSDRQFIRQTKFYDNLCDIVAALQSLHHFQAQELNTPAGMSRRARLRPLNNPCVEPPQFNRQKCSGTGGVMLKFQ